MGELIVGGGWMNVGGWVDGWVGGCWWAGGGGWMVDKWLGGGRGLESVGCIEVLSRWAEWECKGHMTARLVLVLIIILSSS